MSDLPIAAPRASGVAEVLDLFDRWGDDTYDEAVSQNDHATQTAALAHAHGSPEPLIAAALLHDVGHLLELDAGNAFDGSDAVDHRHQDTGAEYLSGIFPDAVTEPIRLHVAAKRYRCGVDQRYRATLSPGSEASLIRQGGAMSTEQIAAFDATPFSTDAVALREWDDAGKVDGLEVAPVASWRALLIRVSSSPT